MSAEIVCHGTLKLKMPGAPDIGSLYSFEYQHSLNPRIEITPEGMLLENVECSFTDPSGERKTLVLHKLRVDLISGALLPDCGDGQVMFFHRKQESEKPANGEEETAADEPVIVGNGR
jgi:hypothetical protein